MSWLPRPRLTDALAAATDHRLTVVVADAGFGKSTLLREWAADRPVAWYALGPDDASPAHLGRGVVDALRRVVPGFPRARLVEVPGDVQSWVSLVCDALSDVLAEHRVLVLDDLHEIHAAPDSEGLVEALVRHMPDRLHLVLASRRDPPFAIDRLRGQGAVLELTAGDLAFTRDELATLLRASLGPEAAEVAGQLAETTGGWPAAVRLAVEALQGGPPVAWLPTLEAASRRGGTVFRYLANEVFARAPEQVRDLVRAGAILDRFTEGTCDALGIADAGATIERLSRSGLFLQQQAGEHGWYRLHALVRDYALDARGLSALSPDEVRRRAAMWFEGNGHVADCLRELLALGDHAGAVRVLAEHGPRLLAAGVVDLVVRTVESLPDSARTAAVERLAGEAYQIRGEWTLAFDCFERAGAGLGTLPAALAWRMGLVQYWRGRFDEALATFARARPEPGEPADEALLLAWRAAVLRVTGDMDACRELATAALARATECGDQRALAAAHATLAVHATAAGDRAAAREHDALALAYAERAGDVVQVVRIRSNRGSHLIYEGRYEAAVDELDAAVRLAEVAGFANFHALALNNRGDARRKLGRLDEALADLEAARDLYERIGSANACYPLANAGDVYRERGDRTLARTAYEHAVTVAETAGNVQGLVPALAGLARVVATENPEQATLLADRALDAATGGSRVAALLAATVVALERHDRSAAARFAADALAAARDRRDPAGIAEGLHLSARACPDDAAALAWLEESAALWRDLRAPVGESLATLDLAERIGGPHGHALATRAEAELRAVGARGHAQAAAQALGRIAAPAQEPALTLQTLGEFRLVRDGEPVPAGEWRSKKARDLLKILVARRGRPTTREQLMEMLWPGEDPVRLSNRLSVAIATVRGVADPGKRYPAHHVVVTDRSSVHGGLGHRAVDVDEFLTAASEALAAWDSGDRRAALRLAAAEVTYVGDFLEENVYDDWAAALRDEARATYLAVCRALADAAAGAGEWDAAVRRLLRILEREPYDEPAYLGLVTALATAGRHGEARRWFVAYCARMEEIGVEAAPLVSRDTRAV